MKAFLVGLGLGALVGVAYAPRPGRETRRQLEARTRQSLDAANDRVGAVRERVNDARTRVTSAAQQVKRSVGSFREQLGGEARNESQAGFGLNTENAAGRNNPGAGRESHRSNQRTSAGPAEQWGADQDISATGTPNTEMAIGGDAGGEASETQTARPSTFLEVINDWPEERLIAIHGIGP